MTERPTSASSAATSTTAALAMTGATWYELSCTRGVSKCVSTRPRHAHDRHQRATTSTASSPWTRHSACSTCLLRSARASTGTAPAHQHRCCTKAPHHSDYWARFEKFVKDLTLHYQDVFVVTGPLFLPRPTPTGLQVSYPVIGARCCVGTGTAWPSARHATRTPCKHRAAPRAGCSAHTLLQSCTG